MKKKIFSVGLILFVFFGLPGYAQFDSTFNAFQQNVQQQYQTFKEKNEELFNNFVRENDKKFSNLLKKAWSDYELLAGEQAPDRPKPDETPKIDPVEVEEDEPEEIPVKPVEPEEPESPEPKPEEPEQEEQTKPVTPPVQKVEPDEFPQNTARFDYFGVTVNLKYDKDFITAATGTGKDAIASFWDEMIETKHYHFINQVRSYQSLMNLNDWGYYNLLKKATEQIAQDEATRKMLTWFFLAKSRYKTKIAYQNDRVFLLLPSKNMMYGRPYYTFNGVKYFMMDKYGGSIKTYDGSYPDARMIFDFDIRKPINLGKNIREKQLSFSYKGNDYAFPVKYNQYNIDFYDAYPHVEMKVYFDAVMSQEAKESILKGLKPVVEGKSESDAAGILLNFVQTAFSYKTDDEQFGREKFFFAEELIHFPYSDCEDRSVLFGYLVRELLNLEVVGLGYPGHMATAVHFSNDLGRDYLMHDNKKFTICDPTYIGAPIGMAMPQVAGKEAEIIEMDNFQVEAYSRREIWKMLTKAGAYPGGMNQNIVFDENDYAYVTGFIAEKANLGGKTYETDNNEVFVAKLSPRKKIEWIRTFEGDGNDAGMSVALKDGFVYLKGTYEDNLKAREFNLKGTHQYDVFVARLSTNGDLGWLSTMPIDEGNYQSDKILVGRFSKNGEHQATITFNETGNFSNYGISFTDKDELLVSVSFNQNALASANKDKISFEAGFRYSPLEYWKNESQRLIRQDYEKTIAGLFAFMKSMKASGTMVDGAVIQEALLEYNPSFRKNTPTIFENIGKISIMKNAGGIITISTDSKQPVNFRQFQVENNTKLRITTYKGGNAQLNFLSGASLGDSFIRFDLNFIKLMKRSGNLLFDYDDDHSQRIVNLEQDILN